MDFKTQVAAATAWGKIECDALLLITVAGGAPAGLDKSVASALDAAAAAGDLEWKAGRTLLLHRVPKVQAPRLACSVAADASPKAFAKAVQAGVQLLKSGGARDLAIALSGAAMTAAHAEAAALAVADAVYVYRHTKPSAPADSPLRSTALLCPQSDLDEAAAGLARGAAIAEGVQLARECANRPPNHCTPGFLASEMRRLGKSHGLKVEVLDRKDCEKLGMGAFLAVAQGSDEPLKFIVARWNGAARTEAPVVLVGKGITFDSGGISLKPAAEMDEMKFDMGGAASVLGTLQAVAALKARVNLIGVIAACENLPSGRAVKPGDVVNTMSGQTVEILNTDAEGRLILCDALTYVERFKPAAVVDIATLTGACMIALGGVRSGLFSPDDALAAELAAAGDAALDPSWRMPMDAEYDEGLKSNFADMANVGGRAGGAVTAAMYLKRFTGKYPWAHLDIAGTAWKSGAAKGATGRPVGLLTHFVLGRAVA
ncbi:MAG: leucyl aminopeptidase [Rubrivivax sp.]|nr:leucyl aminopeptidase [Rubrivivax sp.]